MIKILGVMEGPVHLEDIPQEDWPPYELVEEDMHWMLEVESEPFGGIQMYLRDFDTAYDIMKHFKKSSKPLTLDEESGEISGL